MKHFKNLFLTAITLTLFSCGNDNIVDTSQIPSTGSGGTSNQIGTLSNDNLAVLYGKYSCRTGARLSEMYFTTSNASANGSNITANWQNGTTTGSLIDKSRYVGFSSFNDIMILEKIKTASGTIAFNMIVSFCMDTPLLVQGRNYSNFTVLGPITVSDNLNCSTNNIFKAQTVITAGPYNSYPSTYVETAFTISGNYGLCPF